MGAHVNSTRRRQKAIASDFSGHFGAVRLDGLRAVLLLRYPGAIYEGNRTMQVVIDDCADPAQRDARCIRS
jgi:hypothetical protein